MKKEIYKSIVIASIFLSLFSFIFLISAKEEASSESINVMSFNIRYNNPEDGENAWPYRKEMVAETIRFQKVDIGGLQEALHGQLKDLEALLPEYGWFGVGRDDGRQEGEYTAVFYLKSRSKILNQSTFWLSETPEKPGKGWDAACPRIVTWGKIEDTLTKTIFFFFNTHLDHVGKIARNKSAELLLKKISGLAGNHPVILAGDFNCTEKDTPYKILTSREQTGFLKEEYEEVASLRLNLGFPELPLLCDTYYLSKEKHYGSTQTFNGFQDEINPGYRIDFIFVRNIEEVLRYGIISEKWDGRFVSDHNAVLAEIKFAGRFKL